MAAKATIVVDNSVAPSSGAYLAEHGFSALLEINGKHVLVDTGQSGIAVHNLGLMGIHCNDLDAIVLSHGHYDHTGGMALVLKQRSKPIPVYAHVDLFAPHYAKKGESYSYVGIPHVKEELTSLGAQWHLFEQPDQILPNLWFSGSIPRTSTFEEGDKKLVVVGSCACEAPDSIKDDCSLYYLSDQGLVVISGCAHSGFVNTVEYGLATTGASTLRGWIGGTHLGPVSLGQLDRTLEFIGRHDPAFIAAGHCTGFKIMSRLYQTFGDKFIPAFIGTTIEF